jgi:hypothetical protein
MFLLSREQARAYYGASEGTDGTRPSREGEPRLDPRNELYKLLGLIPDRPETDVARQSTDNLIGQITGFYAPELKAFYMLNEIIGGVNGGSATATMAHEFAHALQDQRHDLNRLTAERADDWDATRALQQVMEGDALAAENAYLGFSLRSTYRRPMCFQIPPRARPNVAFVVERELDTWYEDGVCFVDAVLPHIEGIEALWERLPTTTEQILHPEKYLAGERAITITLPSFAGLGPQWRRLESSSFGEFSVQNLLLLGMTDRPAVQRAAAGWGGDDWALYVNEGGRLFSYAVRWDSNEEAGEFWTALVLSLTNRGAVFAASSETALDATIDGRGWRAQLTGDRVTILVSNDTTALGAAAALAGLP